MKRFFPFPALLPVFVFIGLGIFLSSNLFGQATCGTAPVITPSITCITTAGDLQGATSSGPAGTCGGATATTTNGVWYRFTAKSPSATITVDNLGTNLTAATTYVEVLRGGCGTPIPVACQNVSTALNLTTLMTD